MQNQPYQYQTGFRYSIRIQYEGYRGHFRSKARQPHYAPGHSKRTVKLTFHGPFDGLIWRPLFGPSGESRTHGLLNPIVVRSFYKGNPRKIWTIKRPFTLLPPCRKSCAFSPVPPHSTSPIGWSIGELAWGARQGYPSHFLSFEKEWYSSGKSVISGTKSTGGSEFVKVQNRMVLARKCRTACRYRIVWFRRGV